MTSRPDGSIFERIVEKFKERERRIGMELGLEKGRAEARAENDRKWMAWYERQQAAQREGRPFDELPPGYYSENRNDDNVPSASKGKG